MTTIITRLYKDLATAHGVVAALKGEGHDEATIDIISHDEATIDIISHDGDGSAEERMARARVPAASAAAYGPGIAKGAALVVVRAPFAPMGTARNAIKVVNRTAAMDVGLANEDVYIREQPRQELSDKILPGTVFYMTNPYRSPWHGHILGSQPLLPSRERTSAIRGGGHMSTAFWPMKLVTTGRQANSAIRSGFLFSRMFGIPTLSGDLPSRELIKTTI